MTVKDMILKLTNVGIKGNIIPVIFVDRDNNQIFSEFELYDSIIHPSMYCAIVTSSGSNNLTVDNILSKLYKVANSRNHKLGYKGQEEDYAEPLDRQIILSGNMKSVYCGKYKYVTPIHIKKVNDRVIITCIGE